MIPCTVLSVQMRRFEHSKWHDYIRIGCVAELNRYIANKLEHKW